MSGSREVLFERQGAIATISFNRPAVMNAINQAMSEAFLEACRSIASDASVRVVVLRGEGKAFVAGGDLASLSDNSRISAPALIRPLHQGLAILTGLAQPVLASLHGAVAGAGVGLALAADLAIAADNTRFNLAYTQVGTSLDASSSWHLPRVVGLRKALELALLAETIDAAQALQLGLVNRVVGVAALADETQALAERLARGPTVAYGRVKQLLRAAALNPIGPHMDAEERAFCACAETTDFAEGMDAFMNKRKPVFVGS
jgi:2-(1,2-epoxy-1,2-dihydrophenyl)acetyl-CoA isomerase